MLVLLFSGLVACSGVFGSPLTDDVATLDTLVRRIACSHLSLLVFFFFSCVFRIYCQKMDTKLYISLLLGWNLPLFSISFTWKGA